jgi:hypothetical protein
MIPEVEEFNHTLILFPTPTTLVLVSMNIALGKSQNSNNAKMFSRDGSFGTS